MCIDVGAVRLIVPNGSIQLELAEQNRSGCRRCTVCAVYRNTQTGQISRNGLCQIIGVFFYRINAQRQHAANGIVGCLRQLIHVVNILLDARFQLIRELIAAAGKDFNAVVLIRIVRCRNHNARIRLVLDGQMRHCRSRNDTQRLYIRTGRTNAGNQSSFQHIGRDTSILANQNLGAVFGLLRQRICNGAAYFKCQMCVQFYIDNTADAICSKILAHTINTPLLSDKIVCPNLCSTCCYLLGFSSNRICSGTAGIFG